MTLEHGRPLELFLNEHDPPFTTGFTGSIYSPKKVEVRIRCS